MDIAQARRRENIAEYILYLWQIEDLLRALQFSPEAIYSQLIAAVNGIDGGLIEMAEVYNINRREKLTKIYLPLISPNILSQSGADISLGIKVMISAEVLAGTYESMGGLMQNARVYVDMPRLAALTLIAVLTGLCIDLCFSFTEKFMFKWSKKESYA